MEQQYFIPYTGNQPALMTINGHKVCFISTERAQLEDCLEELGGNAIHQVDEDDYGSPEVFVEDLATATDARVVIPPEEVELHAVIETLRMTLPWTQ